MKRFAPRVQVEKAFLAANDEECEWAVSPDNPDCLLNDLAIDVDPLRCAAANALGNSRHLCEERFLLLGPADEGERVAQAIAETLDLPFVAAFSDELVVANDLLLAIAEACDRTIVTMPEGECSLELVPVRIKGTTEPFFLLPPPLIVYIDDVSALRPALKRTIRSCLRNGEFSDEGGWRVDTRHVCWMLGCPSAQAKPNGLGDITTIDVDGRVRNDST